MAAVVTQTGLKKTGPITRFVLDWLSHTDGTATATTPTLNGTLVRVAFIPDSGGTQPTDLYDVTLNDEDGLDTLAGQGANLSNSTKSNVIPGVPLKDGTTTSVGPMVVNGPLSLSVSGAGSGKGGQVILYLR
jgi:hypothetical protein